MSWRQYKSHYAERGRGDYGRIKVLAVFFIIFCAVIVGRLFDLQVLKGGFYAALASGQHELYQKLFPERGSIYVVEEDEGQKSLFPLVANRELKMLYAVPQEIEKPEEAAQKIFEIFGLPEELDIKQAEAELFKDIAPDLEPKLAEEIKAARREKWYDEQKEKEIKRLTDIFGKENDPYEPVRHKLTDEQAAKVEALQIKGLYFKEETWRYYPEKDIGGHLLGFWGFEGEDRKGKYGLEGYFNAVLAGKFGEIYSEKDAWGNLISVGRNFLQEKEDGSDLILTIDRAIQYKACQVLKYYGDKHEAQSGSVVVMDPKTGAILAMCGYPDFNPDEYNKVESINIYNNPAIFNAYEPGSIFKGITMAAALDAGKVDPFTTYEDTGSRFFKPYTIKNFNDKVYGKKNMTEVLENSINTGAIFAMEQATPEVFTQYVKDFGFGRLTGIELDKEVAGDISNLGRQGAVYAATASFGQGIMVTPLQMVTAYSAIANGGKLMKPYIVSQIIKHQDEKELVQNFYPQETGQVISAKAAAMLGGMLVSVVENGHAKLAAVSGYRVAGKTGTAQVASQSGRGYSGEVSVTFVGFAPFSNPRFAMIVNLHKPKSGREAAISSAPAFSEIAKFILQYYNVPYDKQVKGP